jgi:hypothetical protein
MAERPSTLLGFRGRRSPAKVQRCVTLLWRGLDSKFQDEAASWGLLEGLDEMRMTRRSPRLAEVAEVATLRSGVVILSCRTA